MTDAAPGEVAAAPAGEAQDDQSAPAVIPTAQAEPPSAAAPDRTGPADQSLPQGSLRHRLALRMFLAALALSPALFGASDPVVASFWCAWLALGILVAPLGQLSRPASWWLAGCAAIVAAYAFILHEQIAERPFLAATYPIWAQAGDALGSRIAGAAAMVRNQALYSIGPAMAALLAFILGLICCDTAQDRRLVVVALRYSTVAYAVFGIASTGLEPSMILWRERLGYVGAVTGPFINANTAADYFTIGAIAWLVAVIQRGGGFAHGGAGSHDLRPAGWRLESLDLRAVTALTGCLAALMLTRSRVGVGLGCLTLLATFLALDQRPGRLWQRLAIPGLTLLVLLQLMGAALFVRLDQYGFSGGGRLETYKAALRMIADNPWFGVGIGAFGAVFPGYRTEGSLWGVWDAAHSTPLELAAEAGLPLACLVILAWCALAVALVRRFISSPESIAKIALPAVIVGALHSLVDFSLQTAGYAIPILALAGAALRAEPAQQPASPRR